VPLSAIVDNAHNPRRKLVAIAELAESIRTYGLLQPPLVRQARHQYELVAGHRRVAAARLLGWTEMPVLVRPVEPDEAYLLVLVDNLQRTELTPREEAAGLELLLRERGWSTRQVAAAVHRSPAYVSKRLRVFDDPLLGPLVLRQRLTVSAAEELLVLGPADRQRLAEQALREAWDHARIREAVHARFESKRRQPSIRVLSQQLRRALLAKMPTRLTRAERRELRLLFQDLSLVARRSSDT
jgi:ParB family chromosome partitioning protein